MAGLATIAHSIVAPFLPVYADELNISLVRIGALVSAYGITRFLTQPLIGWWTDRAGSHLTIRVMVFIFAIAGLGYALSTSFVGLLFFRVLQAAAAGGMSVAVRAYVPRHSLKAEVATDIQAVFNAANRDEAEALLAKLVTKYQKSAARLATWMEVSIPEGLTVFAFPATHRRRIGTTNGLERLNREVRRRSRVATLFPNEASCLRLVTAVLMEISEEWETGRTYLSLDC